MSVSKHEYNLYRSQVVVGGECIQKYGKTFESTLAIDNSLMKKAADSGSYVFEKKSRKDGRSLLKSTMPLLSSDGAPRYMHIIKKTKMSKKSGIVHYYSICFKFLGKRDGVRKAFTISKDGFDCAFKEAVEFGYKALGLNEKQKRHWIKGKEVLKEKYLLLKNNEND